MGVLRAAVRLVALLLGTAPLYLVWILTRITVPFSDELAHRTHHWVVRTWARSMLAIMGVKINVVGEPPAPPFFLVSNHLSYVDVLVLLTRVDGLFLAKSEIAKMPFFGHLAKVTGTLFVDRKRKSDLIRVVEAVEKVMASGWGVVMFPEGTSSSGEVLMPFKSSIFEVAVKVDCPVYHASVTYETTPPTLPARLAVCWWGDMSFFPHFLQLLTLPSVAAGITFGAEPVKGGSRKILAQRAYEAIHSHFIPVSGSGEPTMLS